MNTKPLPHYAQQPMDDDNFNHTPPPANQKIDSDSYWSQIDSDDQCIMEMAAELEDYHANYGGYY